MNLEPTVGCPGVPFGTLERDLVESLGRPKNTQVLPDTEGYPRSRRTLNYVRYGFLVTPEQGVIAILVEATETRVLLWDTDITDMSSAELCSFIGARGHDARIGMPDRWGDYDVEAIDCGIIAAFSEGKLESIEIHQPGWRD